MARIYVASSWRNKYYPEVVEALRSSGHEVYDFRNPPHGGNGFHWTDIDENAPNWTFEQYAEGLLHPLAEKQFQADINALYWADICVLVLPCGRSAHTEAGYMAGKGKKVVVYIPEMQEPELMYKLFNGVVHDIDGLKNYISTMWNKGREFTKVDLGLSVYWADRNIGALTEDDPGDLVGWKKIGQKVRLAYRNGQFVKCPNNWRLPTWDEAVEVVKNCTCEVKRFGEQWGELFTGPSGESIFLPYGGSLDLCHEDDNKGVNDHGYYLCRTLRYDNSTFMRLEGKPLKMENCGTLELLMSARLVISKGQ